MPTAVAREPRASPTRGDRGSRGGRGGERVGIRLSPVSPVNGAASDSDPDATYTYVVERLNAFELAYIHVIEGVTRGRARSLRVRPPDSAAVIQRTLHGE